MCKCKKSKDDVNSSKNKSKVYVNYAFLINTALIALVVGVLVAIALNFVLQCHITDNVIGKCDDESIWLTFWGALLSAIGSFVVAVVSFYQNSASLRQSKNVFEYENKYRMYEELEKFIEQSCLLFNTDYYFGRIVRLVNSLDLAKAKSLNTYYGIQLFNISTRIVRFKQIFPKMQEFGNTMANANSVFMNLQQELDNIITAKEQQKSYIGSDEYHSYCKSVGGSDDDMQLFWKYVQIKENQQISYYHTLTEQGFDLLHEEIKTLGDMED